MNISEFIYASAIFPSCLTDPSFVYVCMYICGRLCDPADACSVCSVMFFVPSAVPDAHLARVNLYTLRDN